MKPHYFLSFFLLLLMSHAKLAYSGLLFNIKATGGAPGAIAITLCLNGKGPISCQNYSVSNLNLSLLSTIPNHTYTAAGIKVNTPGYQPNGCTMVSNGYCLFTVSNTSAASIALTDTN